MKDLEGFEELARSFGNVEKALTDKELSKAARKGATPLLAAARARAPKDTGLLSESIITNKERSRYRGKAVYDIMFDPQKNDVLQKPIKKRIRSKSKYAYYPASQEYGFFTRRPGGGMTYTRSDGSKATMNKVPGKHFMLSAAENVGEAAKTAVVESLWEAVEKEFDA